MPIGTENNTGLNIQQELSTPEQIVMPIEQADPGFVPQVEDKIEEVTPVSYKTWTEEKTAKFNSIVKNTPEEADAVADNIISQGYNPEDVNRVLSNAKQLQSTERNKVPEVMPLSSEKIVMSPSEQQEYDSKTSIESLAERADKLEDFIAYSEQVVSSPFEDIKSLGGYLGLGNSQEIARSNAKAQSNIAKMIQESKQFDKQIARLYYDTKGTPHVVMPTDPEFTEIYTNSEFVNPETWEEITPGFFDSLETSAAEVTGAVVGGIAAAPLALAAGTAVGGPLGLATGLAIEAGISAFGAGIGAGIDEIRAAINTNQKYDLAHIAEIAKEAGIVDLGFTGVFYGVVKPIVKSGVKYGGTSKAGQYVQEEYKAILPIIKGAPRSLKIRLFNKDLNRRQALETLHVLNNTIKSGLNIVKDIATLRTTKARASSEKALRAAAEQTGMTETELLARVKPSPGLQNLSSKLGMHAEEVYTKLDSPVKITEAAEKTGLSRKAVKALVAEAKVFGELQPTKAAREVADLLGYPVDELYKYLDTDIKLKLEAQRTGIPEKVLQRHAAETIAHKYLAETLEQLTTPKAGLDFLKTKTARIRTQLNEKAFLSTIYMNADAQIQATIKAAARRSTVVEKQLAKGAEERVSDILNVISPGRQTVRYVGKELLNHIDYANLQVNTIIDGVRQLGITATKDLDYVFQAQELFGPVIKQYSPRLIKSKLPEDLRQWLTRQQFAKEAGEPQGFESLLNAKQQLNAMKSEAPKGSQEANLLLELLNITDQQIKDIANHPVVKQSLGEDYYKTFKDADMMYANMRDIEQTSLYKILMGKEGTDQDLTGHILDFISSRDRTKTFNTVLRMLPKQAGANIEKDLLSVITNKHVINPTSLKNKAINFRNLMDDLKQINFVSSEVTAQVEHLHNISLALRNEPTLQNLPVVRADMGAGTFATNLTRKFEQFFASSVWTEIIKYLPGQSARARTLTGRMIRLLKNPTDGKNFTRFTEEFEDYPLVIKAAKDLQQSVLDVSTLSKSGYTDVPKITMYRHTNLGDEFRPRNSAMGFGIDFKTGLKPAQAGVEKIFKQEIPVSEILTIKQIEELKYIDPSFALPGIGEKVTKEYIKKNFKKIEAIAKHNNFMGIQIGDDILQFDTGLQTRKGMK